MMRQVEMPRVEELSRSVAAVDRQNLQLMAPRTPAIAGLMLAASLTLAESPVGPAVTHAIAKLTLGGLFKALRQQRYPEEPRLSCIPQRPAEPHVGCIAVSSAAAAARVEAAVQALTGHPCTEDTFGLPQAYPSILDYHRSFTAGMSTPSIVAERVISFLEAHNARHNWLSAWSAQHIREAAAAATERYKAGKPLSVLDGVPFVVKDCIDALPYATSYGTRFMGTMRPAKADAPCVAALKELGAVLLGKGAMVEFGCLATGFNTHAGSTRNPHNPKKMSGGSSSGSAAAVAAGLCPIAIGTDGGGSIRVPASYCGVLGLKTTKGRLADDHGAHGCFSSVTVTGPIATNTSDLLLLYAALANVDYSDMLLDTHIDSCDSSTNSRTNTSNDGATRPSNSSSSNANTNSIGLTCGSQGSVAASSGVARAAAVSAPQLQPLVLPELLLPSRNQLAAAGAWQPLLGVRLGLYKEWFSMCSPGVHAAVSKAVEGLIGLGATIVHISLPELDLLQAAHTAVFSAEYFYDAGQAGWRDEWRLRKQLNLDSRMFYCNAGMFTADDYDTALRVRARAMVHFEHAFQECDIIVTPATPTTAPDLPAAVHVHGVYDVAQTLETIRFTQAANLTGLPALVMPAGRAEEDDMPVGIQFIGDHFAEATLLKVAAALERHQKPLLPAGLAGDAAAVLLAAQPHMSSDDTNVSRDQSQGQCMTAATGPKRGTVWRKAGSQARQTKGFVALFSQLLTRKGREGRRNKQQSPWQLRNTSVTADAGPSAIATVCMCSPCGFYNGFSWWGLPKL